MSYLEQFARNRRSKGNTKVLTARLPEDLYDDFQKHCDLLGLSISEAICLLVDKEVSSIQGETRSLPTSTEDSDVKYKTNTGEYELNTNTGETNTFSRNDKVQTKPKIEKKTTGKFPVKPFVVNNQLPCPICDKWVHHSNFAKHAKTQHETNTEAIYTEYKDKAEEMVKNKSVELEANRKSAD